MPGRSVERRGGAKKEKGKASWPLKQGKKPAVKR